MTKYKSFYFLHIPKTAGRFLAKYVINPVEKQLEKNGIKIIDSTKPGSRGVRHLCWNKNIDDNTYVFSIFREPVNWACSWFIHHKYAENGAIKIDDELIVEKDLGINFSGKDVISWINQYPFLQNCQSKNFMFGGREELIKFSGQLKKENVISRLERVNLLIKQDYLKNMDYNKIIEKIESDFGVEIDYRVPDDIDRRYYANSASDVLYSSLSNFEGGSIKDLLSLDVEIYNNDNLFWPTK